MQLGREGARLAVAQAVVQQVAQQQPQAGSVEPHCGQVRRCVQGNVGGARMAGAQVGHHFARQFGDIGGLAVQRRMAARQAFAF